MVNKKVVKNKKINFKEKKVPKKVKVNSKNLSPSKLYDTIIIGAGISGLTAAMYAARKRMKYEIISSDFGGQFMVSGEVLNYPGIIKTNGVEFSNIMEEQMKFNDVKIKLETVKSVKKTKNGFKVLTDKKEYDTKTVLVTTGSKPRKLNVLGEEKFQNMGVTYCSICDGPLFKGKDVVIVGGGASALEAVDFMRNIARKIYVIVRGDKFTGHEYLIEKVKKIKKVKVFFNTETTEIVGDRFVNGLKYKQTYGKVSKNSKNEKSKISEKELKVEAVIVEIGRLPNTEFVNGLVELDEHKHIQIDNWGKTNVEGIFAAGDCASGHEYQYVISAGQGCMALLKTVRYLAGKK
ncbi:MAG: FAD-dependent oxidoreductase [archaeon]|nr:NAD(P)/FAD-dependent oxidoreductase [Nanoarchaeota archaeon]